MIKGEHGYGEGKQRIKDSWRDWPHEKKKKFLTWDGKKCISPFSLKKDEFKRNVNFPFRDL